MSLELILLLSVAIVVGALLYGILSQLFSLGDLECDYLNTFDLTRRVNDLVPTEFITQGALCAIFLLTRHWSMFLLSAPITCYHLNLYMRRKHIIDVTEVFRVLENEKRYRLVKLLFYVILFSLVMFRFVLTGAHLVLGEDIEALDGFWTF